jgi:hypothetical protein
MSFGSRPPSRAPPRYHPVQTPVQPEWQEVKMIGAPGEFEALQDDELERLLVQQLGELGFSLSPIVEIDSETEH